MTRHLTLLFLLGAMACGGGGAGGAFGPTFPDNRAGDIETVLGRLERAPASTARPVAVGLTNAPHQLYAVDLTSGDELWRESVSTPVSAPRIAANLVILHEQAGVVARDLGTGRRAFDVGDDALHLAGVAGEGDLAFVALTTGGGVGARSKLVLARGSSVSWTKVIDHAVGRPELAGGMVFVPWATQNVSVLDASSGDEIARLRITDTTVGHVFRHGDDVYLGQRGIFRLTPTIATGSTEGAAHFEPLPRELPGDPAFLIDPYGPQPGPASAVHRIRLEWQPSGSGDEVTLQDDVLYAVFYRFVFALDPDEDAVKWVYQHPEDIVGATAQDGGLFLADMGGGFAFVGADGRRTWSASVDATPTVVSFRPGGHVPRGSPEGEVTSLHDQLLAAAQNTDSRLVPARTLAVHMMHALEEPDVTGHLIELCDDRRAPPTVREEACTLLGTRTSGGEHVLEALGRHARFLEGSSAPPVGPLARAAVNLDLGDAVPLLLSQLQDPETPETALPPLIAALKHLEDQSAVTPLRDFLRLYHAEAESDPMIEAMGSAADALVALQGPVAEELLAEVSEDPLAPGIVRGRVMESLDSLRARLAEAEGEGEGEEGEEGADGDGEEADGEEADGEEAEPQIPVQVTAPMVERILMEDMIELRGCVRADEQHARSARVVLVLDGDGNVALVSVSPHRLQGCVEPILRRHRYPANQHHTRQNITLNLRR